MKNVIVKTISSIEKVMLGKEPICEQKESSVLKGERCNFQLAFFSGEKRCLRFNKINVTGEIAPFVTVRSVLPVPVDFVSVGADDYYESREVGLFPDLLKPFDKLQFMLPPNQWRAVWVSVDTDKVAAGKHEISIELVDENGEKLIQVNYFINVLDVKIRKNDLILCNWMHYDCICTQHGVAPFSDKFYSILGEYLKAYVDVGMNTLLTPIFTPPLDTAVGTYRKTIQLIGVEKTEEGYKFDFSKLEKFVRFALECGVKRFEISHLFTQWGGSACPKIMGKENGKQKMLFGWHTSSVSPKYEQFLEQFLPLLIAKLDELGVVNNCYFHLTDEPHLHHFDSYKKCSALVKKHLGSRPIMDAMSEPKFYEEGLVDIPVAVTDSYEKFDMIKREDLMVYTCCFPDDRYYSNRFINMPALRMRVLGVQLYSEGVAGYLHWGFNFYNSVLSVEKVDPYADTSCGGYYPAGDAFIVYPTSSGVNYSLRAETFREAIADYEALCTLEGLIGREKTLALVEEFGFESFTKYPKTNETFIRFREKLNETIAKWSKVESK